MQKQISEIRREIANGIGRTAWNKGVRGYADELLDSYLEGLHITDESVRIGKIKEKDLLNGAQDWNQYSWGGCADIYDSDICERLCNASEKKKSRDGERKPNANEEWLDVQARALFQAARLVLNAVNGRANDNA
jgi:hypothetical protein